MTRSRRATAAEISSNKTGNSFTPAANAHHHNKANQVGYQQQPHYHKSTPLPPASSQQQQQSSYTTTTTRLLESRHHHSLTVPIIKAAGVRRLLVGAVAPSTSVHQRHRYGQK
jgi:hypothetical protein